MDQEWPGQGAGSNGGEADKIPVAEPISKEISQEVVGAFAVRVQALMDLCSAETSELLATIFDFIKNNEDMEHVLDQLEQYAHSIMLGSLSDSSEEEMDKETDLLNYVIRICNSYIKSSPPRSKA